MRYESLLASRYIKAQKRQSVFTVVSIAVAVAVMTMLFVLYGVLMSNARAANYNTSPYHLIIYDWPENKASALRNEAYVQSVSFECPWKGTLIAKITFEKDLDDPKSWLEIVKSKYGGEAADPDSEFGTDGASILPVASNYDWNDDLMLLDGIGSEAIVKRFMYFWVFFVFVLLFALTLRLIVDTAFEISSRERERHYGVLQSIGATPRQIVGIITRESLRLCVVAIPLGLVFGVLFAFGMCRAVLSAGLSDMLRSAEAGDLKLSFTVQPLMLLVSVGVGLIWTLLSAYGVGMRVVRKTPMEAITARAKRVTKIKKCSLAGLLFGLPGRIASRNARRQKKRFRITVLTLTISITLFAIFTTLADKVEIILLETRTDGLYNTDLFTDFYVDLHDDPDSGSTFIDAANLLQSCGLFRNVVISASESLYLQPYDPEVEYSRSVWVSFCDRATYQENYGDLIQNGQVPSYEGLKNSDGYIYVPIGKQPASDSLYENEKQLLSGAQSGRLSLYSYFYTYGPDYACEEEDRIHEITICGIAAQPEYGIGELVGTMETYAKIRDDWFDDPDDSYDPSSVSGYLQSSQLGEHSNAEYQKIQEFFHAHSRLISVGYDSYEQILNVQNAMAAIRAGVLFLNCIIALAALINLLNIVSTGIANRRNELASLQCVGMTEGQLLRTTLIECLQYVLRAALIAAVICTVIMVSYKYFLTHLLFEDYETVLSYEEDPTAIMFTNMEKLNVVGTYVRIVLAAVAAFAAGCAASVSMLRAQRRQSLSERIRSVE